MLSRILNFKLPLLLFLILLFSLLWGHMLPINLKAFFYTISLSIKSSLIFVLPFIVFSFVFSIIGNLQKGALKFSILLVSGVILSNFFSTLLAFGVGTTFLKEAKFLSGPLATELSLDPLWDFSLPKLISNDWALLGGFVFGLIFSYIAPEKQKFYSQKLVHFSLKILNKIFIPLMPLFILGFCLKLQHDQVLVAIFKDYPKIFLIIGSAVFSYIFLMYGAVNRFKKRWFVSFRNMIAPIITAFSTMSSAAAMPLTIKATEKNIHSPEMARVIIPATVNIHLTGDCFAIPIFALSILVTFGIETPDLIHYLPFAFYFVLAKFAVAAVPGGGILVMLPVLEQHLGFSSPMLSLITTLYVIFDPVITSANVLGNGVFAMALEKLHKKIGTKKKEILQKF